MKSSAEMFDFLRDLIQLPNVGQRLLGTLGLVGDIQAKKLTPGVRHTAHLGDSRAKADFVATNVVTNQTKPN